MTPLLQELGVETLERHRQHEQTATGAGGALPRSSVPTGAARRRRSSASGGGTGGSRGAAGGPSGPVTGASQRVPRA